jgi:hypothetical protein
VGARSCLRRIFRPSAGDMSLSCRPFFRSSSQPVCWPRWGFRRKTAADNRLPQLRVTFSWRSCMRRRSASRPRDRS